MPANLIEIKNIVKRFGDVQAVNDISLAVKKGSCVGLLGPNGAGKSTTMEIMEGIKKPSSGSVLYKNKALGQQFKLEAGIMFQNTALQQYIRVGEILTMFATIYNNKNVASIIKKFQLEEFINQETQKISGGQRQRLLLAIALINDPQILFLDEPTTGLDPQSRHHIWELLAEVKAKGRSIIISTHYMEEAYKLCDEIVIIDNGKIITQGSPKNLLADCFADVLVQIPVADVGNKKLTMEHVINDATVNINTIDVNALIKQLLALQIPLDNMSIRRRNLEDLFLDITSTKLH